MSIPSEGNLKPIHAGRVTVSWELIAQALRLPKGHHIVGIRDTSWEWNGQETVELKITGPLMPVVPLGEIIPLVFVTLRTVQDKEVEWVQVVPSSQGEA